jgi:polyhydroxybutyrate depolymerase
MASLGILTLGFLAIGCADSDGGGNACAAKNGPAGQRRIVIDSGGVERSFQLVVPDSAVSGRPVPLVLLYHGALADGQSILTLTGFDEKAAAEGFIVAAGDGLGRTWNAGVCCVPASANNVDDLGFTRAMVAAIAAEYCIDTTRVYATGFSNGAAMAFRLACEATDLFAAFAPVAGSLAFPQCQPVEARPMEIINNVSDPIVPFTLGTFSFDAFTDYNGCTDAREMTQPDFTTTCTIASECSDGATTVLCGVEGTSHQWPGDITDTDGVFEATDAVWDFLSAYHL